jgi:PadR family transcriptional regulator AphA
MSYKYLVLGLLAERPMSGYDIKKHVKTVLGAITSASYGTLYPTLHKLLEDGDVEMQEVPQHGRPSKKVYFLTEQGRSDLRKWLNQPAAADQVKREFLLKLYLAKHFDEADLQAMVAGRRTEAEMLLRTYEADKRNAKTAEQAWIADYSSALCRAELDWLQRFVTEYGAV